MTDSFTTRLAVPSDAALISLHRRLMFTDAGLGTADSLAVMAKNHEPWVARKIAEDRYIGWVTETGGKPVASAGMLLLDWPPHPLDPETAQRAYVLNVWVDPEHRRHKLGRELMQRTLDESRRRNIRITALHATEKGRHLYETLGFQTTNEMYFIAP
jgi:ribosomal protein S18 acetylase RimI-like enzyme